VRSRFSDAIRCIRFLYSEARISLLITGICFSFVRSRLKFHPICDIITRMTYLANYLETVDVCDQKFVGTIAFRNEELTLPDGSKLALGVDGCHWVMVYQEQPGARFQIIEYDQQAGRIVIDKKPGGEDELKIFKQRLRYFFEHARVDDLVTIMPPRAEEK
jgi:hypothetical protein